MTEEEFAAMNTLGKWVHLKKTMDYIARTDSLYEQRSSAHELRQRLNPHHSEVYAKLEEKQLKHEQRSMRIDQSQRWAHVKDLYAIHRDELANTLDNPEYAECRSIMERIFTAEVDDALHKIIGGETQE